MHYNPTHIQLYLNPKTERKREEKKKKLNIKVQSITKVIVQDTKRTFEKFRVQNTIWDIVYGDNM